MGGGGNAQKTAMSRAKNAAKASKDGAGGGGASGAAKRAANMDLKCSICMQTFPSTQKRAAQAHAESKHAKEEFLKCFPMCAEACQSCDSQQVELHRSCLVSAKGLTCRYVQYSSVGSHACILYVCTGMSVLCFCHTILTLCC